MEARLLQQTFMGIAHVTRMKSDRESFKQNFWSCSPEKMGFGRVVGNRTGPISFRFGRLSSMCIVAAQHSGPTNHRKTLND